MTIEEIRENAPKGATHYLDYGVYVDIISMLLILGVG